VGSALRTDGNPKSEVRRPPRPAFDIALCHLKASGSAYSPRRGARYEPGTRHARDSTRLNRNSIKPSAVSCVSMHWLLQGLADAAAGLPNVYGTKTCSPAATLVMRVTYRAGSSSVFLSTSPAHRQRHCSHGKPECRAGVPLSKPAYAPRANPGSEPSPAVCPWFRPRGSLLLLLAHPNRMPN
jgi:hypothetical protein